MWNYHIIFARCFFLAASTGLGGLMLTIHYRDHQTGLSYACGFLLALALGLVTEAAISNCRRTMFAANMAVSVTCYFGAGYPVYLLIRTW